MPHTLYRRDVLYNEVWDEPAIAVAKRYRVSSVALAKTCRKLAVPMPPRGYWARKAAGQTVERPPLPPLPPNTPSELSAWRRAPETSVKRPETEKLRETPQPLTVPESLERPHRLVASAAKVLRKAALQDGRLCQWEQRCLDITVSPAQLDRALRLFDALLSAMDSRGLTVEVTEPLTKQSPRYFDARKSVASVTRVQIAGEWIQIALEEKRRQFRPPTPTPPKGLKGRELETWTFWNGKPRMQLVPNGLLLLSLTACGPDTSKEWGLSHIHRAWLEGTGKRLEQMLPAVVAELPVLAQRANDEREARKRAHLEYVASERLRREEAEREAAEQKRGKELEEEVRRWRLARDIREYLSDMRAVVAAADPRLGPNDELAAHLEWAGRYADQIDPVAQLRANEKYLLTQLDPTEEP